MAETAGDGLETVLVIDDDKAFCAALAGALRRRGLKAIIAHSHDEALAELVELLDADLPAARAAAARGIGSFGALEALPRLIRMLSTETDPTVLDAVNAAIELLTAASPDPES